jgi:hypothetical protein
MSGTNSDDRTSTAKWAVRFLSNVSERLTDRADTTMHTDRPLTMRVLAVFVMVAAVTGQPLGGALERRSSGDHDSSVVVIQCP